MFEGTSAENSVRDRSTSRALPRPWQARARAELLDLQRPLGRWAYRREGAPGVEPTALAALALLSTANARSGLEPSVVAAASWLEAMQGRDGSLGLADGRPAPGWTTPYALLLWSALGERTSPRQRAARWLLDQKGRIIPKEADSDRIVGHDTTLVGWPWVRDTHSWLDPTAMAILALRREGFGTHTRVREGVALILDRAIPEGGWNYGNKAAFGHSLRPQPAPTGLALLALAGLERRTGVVDRAIRYLAATLGQTRAPASLGWGLLGLRAWDEMPADAETWLAESYSRASGKPEAAPRLAVLMLAAGPRALEVVLNGREGSQR